MDHTEESTSEKPAKPGKLGDFNTHTGLSADQHIGVLRTGSPAEVIKQTEIMVLEQDSLFAKSQSWLILNGLDVLNPVMELDREKIVEFNEELNAENIPFQIRYDHKIKSKGITYHYFGAYVYKREVITITIDTGFRPPDLPKEKDRIECNPCQRYFKPKYYDTHIATKTHTEKTKLYEDLGKKPKGEPKTIYLNKYNPYMWRALLGEEVFKQHGQPPRLKLPTNMRYRIVEHGEETTRHIIIPYDVWILPGIKPLFQKCSVFRLA